MTFFREMLSEDNGKGSITRAALLFGMLTACAPVLAWTVMFCFYKWAPEIPAGVIAAQTGILGLVAGLKGWERVQTEATKQAEAKKE